MTSSARVQSRVILPPVQHTFTSLVVTPADAATWLQDNAFDRQRTLRPQRVAFLAHLLVTKKFRQETVLTFGVVERCHYLVNGYHTLAALVQSGVSYALVVEDYPCLTLEDVATLYGTFDRNLARTVGDIYKSYQADIQCNLAPSYVRLVGYALPLLVGGFEQDGHLNPLSPVGLALQDPAWRLQHVIAWQREAQTYFGLLQRLPRGASEKFHRAAVIAVALVTLRHAPEAARAFWSEVVADEGLRTGMPAKTLLRWLMTTPALSQRLRYTRYIASAWNAAYEHRELRMMHPMNLERPILLVGTPHKGQQALRYVDANLAPVFLPKAEKAHEDTV
jgi:hypothetical protein